jgi:hypothetical protein
VTWFRTIWDDIRGASLRHHPAPFPLELASRLIRMFSFVGDTVLDPFMGTGTTNVAAARWGRHSIGIEIEPRYFELARRRLNEMAQPRLPYGAGLRSAPTALVRTSVQGARASRRSWRPAGVLFPVEPRQAGNQTPSSSRAVTTACSTLQRLPALGTMS